MLPVSKSVEIILANQDESGAYVACPEFPTYEYCWFRDGSFIAYAMLEAGEVDSAYRFLCWCSGALLAREADISALEGKLSRGEATGPMDFLPARYALDGTLRRDDWPNFQIDGYGAWLWCLAAWHRVRGEVPLAPEFRQADVLCVRYLSRVWKMPNYDCWEEFGDRVHVSTLACVFGGLEAIDALAPDLGAGLVAAEVRAFVRASVLPVGRFPKYLGSTAVDASLLWLALPFGLVAPGDPAFHATVLRIEETLLREGGVKRYAEDSYYGGGQWIILSAWLGWLYAETGRVEEAEAMLSWVQSAADREGRLPEQVARNLNDPSFLRVWEARWGASASPLLWSHAMHIVLAGAIGKRRRAH